MHRLFAAVVFVASFVSFAAEPIGLSEDEFRMYQQYKAAMSDARVQAMKADKQLPAIAKDAAKTIMTTSGRWRMESVTEAKQRQPRTRRSSLLWCTARPSTASPCSPGESAAPTWTSIERGTRLARSA